MVNIHTHGLNTVRLESDLLQRVQAIAIGNLAKDNNKSISSITYSFLNLPSVITVTGKGTITYTYDAAGNKLKKVTQENNPVWRRQAAKFCVAAHLC